VNLKRSLPFFALIAGVLIFGIAYPPPQTERSITVSQTQRQRPALTIDINSASAELLSLLPSVGMATAKRIVAYREKKGRIKSLRELESIEGLGRRRVEKFRPYVSIR